MMLEDGAWIPAIDARRVGPKTQKMDIETGEDEKDRW
jgi:hypothetical protein